MNFSQALEYMRAGASVRRAGWHSESAIRIHNDALEVRTSGRWAPSDNLSNDDILATDWELAH